MRSSASSSATWNVVTAPYLVLSASSTDVELARMTARLSSTLSSEGALTPRAMLQAPVLMNWMSTLTAATVAAAKVPLLDPLSGSTTPPVWMTSTAGCSKRLVTT